MRFRQLFLLAALTAVIAGACGSGDDTNAEAPDVGSAVTDYEVFSSDEGAGCGVYVSVPSDAVDAATDARAMIWAGLVSQDFTTCGFSDVVEVGLITVNGLDDYDQPDWSTVEEHAYFDVNGWETLVADCFDTAISDSCASALEESLTE